MGTESATILFTDMVGSTELSQRLSPEAADEVRRGHFSILRQAIAEAGGTEVKNLGDGLMVVFASASAALACAVAMQQGVERDNRDREHSVGLRVGLSGGRGEQRGRRLLRGPGRSRRPGCAPRARAGRSSPPTWCEPWPVGAAARMPPARGTDPEGSARPGRDRRGAVGTPRRGRRPGSSVPLPRRLALRPAVGVVGREAEIAAMTDAVKRVAEGRGTRGAAHLGRGRPGQDHAGCRSGPGRLRQRRLRVVRPLRGGPRHPVPALRRSPRPLRHPRPRGSAPRPHRGPRVGTVPAGARPSPAGSRTCRRRRPPTPTPSAYLLFAAVVGLLATVSRAPTGRARARRSPVGRQGKPAAAAPPDGGRAGHAGARPRDLSRQRAVAAPTRSPTPWLRCIDSSGVSPYRAGRARRQRRGVVHGGRRRSHPRRCRRRPRPRRVPRNRRQPVLRERGPAPSVRDRGHLPGRHRPVDGGGLPGADRPARQRARGDRWPGRAAGTRGRARPVDGGGHRPGLRSRPPGRATKATEDELLDILDAADGRGAGARAGRHARALQLRPRPDPTHAV